jgi:Spy/CpxP family protein refolding chaperone
MKTKWKITFVLLGIVLVSFVAGAFLGAKLTERTLKRRHAPEMWNQTVMRALQKNLQLTPEQAQKVQTVIDGGVEQMKGIRLETIARTDAVFEKMVEEIDHDLTPEQSAELQKLKQQRGATTIDMLKVEPRKTK